MDLRLKFPRAFQTNQTSFLTQEIESSIKLAKIFRLSIMGEVRMGKSEVGTTIALLYVKFYNYFYNKGMFDKLDIWKTTKLMKAELSFGQDHIVGSQQDYMIQIRQLYNEGKLKFGQIFQIDEARDAIGGLGSFSTEIDLKNINNIVAKFMISEIWITPDRFLDRNCPYGLYVFKKDMKNRVNWCLLYKIQMGEGMIRNYIFLGWVAVPLHGNDKLRKEYNEKKNQWIGEELLGMGDKRTMLRKEASKLIATDKIFSALTDSGKQFMLSKSQQISILEDFINEGKIQDFNEAEKFRIVDEARMIILRNKGVY